MKLSVRLFAAAAEAAAGQTAACDVPDVPAPTVADVRAALASQAPALKDVLARSWFAVNGEYATDEQPVRSGDEIAVIPPVSGGEWTAFAQDIVITSEPLRVEDMYARLRDPRAGAIVVFAGTVREWTKGRQTLRLEYEAYEEMAMRELAGVRDACRARWPACRVALWHRTGRLELEEISVLVGVSTPHRKDAFAAAQYGIDTLKRTAPIWKREFYTDGQVTWGGPEGDWMPVREPPGASGQ